MSSTTVITVTLTTAITIGITGGTDARRSMPTTQRISVIHALRSIVIPKAIAGTHARNVANTSYASPTCDEITAMRIGMYAPIIGVRRPVIRRLAVSTNRLRFANVPVNRSQSFGTTHDWFHSFGITHDRSLHGAPLHVANRPSVDANRDSAGR